MSIGMEPLLWRNPQSERDIRVAGRESRAKLASRIRGHQPIET
jgi:hypothetical protein